MREETIHKKVLHIKIEGTDKEEDPELEETPKDLEIRGGHWEEIKKIGSGKI